MTQKSARELFNRSLEILGVVGAGQTAEAQDYQTMRSAIGPILAELFARDVINLKLHPTDDDKPEIPEEVFEAIAILLANDVASSFGATALPEAEREQKINRVRRIVGDRPKHLTFKADYF